MASLVVGTFLTLDGVMQGPGGPDEDRGGGFALGGWSVGYWDHAMGQIITAWTARADALLLGRTTYQIFAAHWPHVSDGDPVGSVLNRVPKYVASTTLKTVEWHNSTLLEGDVPAAVAALKDAGSGEIQSRGAGGCIEQMFSCRREPHQGIGAATSWPRPIVASRGLAPSR